jgi:hypothetical protein
MAFMMNNFDSFFLSMKATTEAVAEVIYTAQLLKTHLHIKDQIPIRFNIKSVMNRPIPVGSKLTFTAVGYLKQQDYLLDQEIPSQGN